MRRSPTLADDLCAAYARSGWRGFLTLHRLLGKDTIRMCTAYGAVFGLQPGDYIDGVVLREGFYESEVFEALRSGFAPGAVFWDIGAYFGLQSVSAALAEPAMQVHCFEPSPTILARLQAHAELNGVRLRCWSVALGETDGPGTLQINASGNPGMTTLIPAAGARFDTTLPVRVARAETLIRTGAVPAPTLIKLDVEGGESAVLAGFGDLLHAPGLRAVVFETRADLLADPSRCPAARLLLSAGFVFTALGRHEDSAHLLGNFLATRPGA
jgi:FkbM family methyltransferase